jgi:hypothetical protein
MFWNRSETKRKKGGNKRNGGTNIRKLVGSVGQKDLDLNLNHILNEQKKNIKNIFKLIKWMNN